MIGTIVNLLESSLEALKIPCSEKIHVDRSKRSEHGHFSSSIALHIARLPNLTPLCDLSPISIAEKIVKAMPMRPDIFSKVEIREPGFINFFLSPKALRSIVPDILEAGDKYGRTEIGKGLKVQVEFVSANPTGPLTVGHGRQAVLGDTIARILEWNGYDVEREYYYNDAGRQMRILGHSTYIRYRQLLGCDDPMPDDHYVGEYIIDIAREIVNKYGDRFKDEPDNTVFKDTAEQEVFKGIKRTLESLDIFFDRYYNEMDLYDGGRVEKVLNDLREKNATYEKDGAVWFRAGNYGGSEDRVLWKSVVDEATYRLPDIAYHVTKFDRGFDLIVDIFGADHHATYPDVLAGLRALDCDTDRIRVLIHQFVTLMCGGKKIKMSTRKASFVTLDELIDEVGKDVVRYFFLMRGMNSHLNFNLELAKTEGEENPVFYLQYAHARIASIMRNAEERGIKVKKDIDVTLLKEPETLNLLDVLGEFKEVVATCVETLEPHHLVNYLQKLATAFHKFYTEHRVLSDDTELTKARIVLVREVQIVLANGLHLMGISAPEKM